MWTFIPKFLYLARCINFHIPKTMDKHANFYINFGVKFGQELLEDLNIGMAYFL